MRNFIITVEGKRYEVGVEEVGEGAAAPKAVPVQAQAPQATPAAAPKAETNHAKGTKILSPFPGLIKSLTLENGKPVKKDQPVLVLEAMKMDNDITAPCDGVVTYCVQKGQTVESDTVLAIIG